MVGMNRFFCGVCAVFACLMVSAQSVKAQAMDAVAHVYSVGGWDLIEVKDSTDLVMGFWGIPRVPVEVGNIRRLWFEAIPNNEWDVWAFEPVAIFDKISDLQVDGASSESLEFLMYEEFLAADTAINQDVDGGVSGQVVKGFISGDPLTEAAGAMNDPDPMIDLLAGVGYPIAPGMSDLLVDGTAGVNVTMNSVTKQTLDCLRSQNNGCTTDCVCTKHEGPVTYDPWIIYETWVTENKLRCEFSRIEHHSYWKTGEDPDANCADCTLGSAESPILYDVLIERTEYWLDVDHCPDSPLNY